MQSKYIKEKPKEEFKESLAKSTGEKNEEKTKPFNNKGVGILHILN